MPFTFAHPALLVPFHRYSNGWISWTALIIGTMVPDFEYFFRLETVSIHSHTLLGLLYWDIPIGLILFIIYNHLVKKVVYPNLPLVFQQRLFDYSYPIPFCTTRHLVIICSSICFGAITHLFWDAWTHPTGYFVMYFDSFQKQVVFQNYTIPYYKIAQHGSSLIGLIALLFFLFRLPKKKTTTIPRIKNFWVFILASTVIAYLSVFFIFPTQAIGALIVRAISFAMLSIIINSFIFLKSIK